MNAECYRGFSCWSSLLFTYSQGVDGKDVLLALLGHLLVARLDQVVEEHEGLVHMPVVLAVVIEPLPDHLHDL